LEGNAEMVGDNGKRKWAWLVAILVLVVVGFGYFYRSFTRDTWQDEVPPRVNADGTIDYVLMEKSNKYEGHYWVYRLPKEIYVERSQTRDLGRFSADGISAGLRETANSYLTVYFLKDSLRPAVSEDKITVADTIGLVRLFQVTFENLYMFDDNPTIAIGDAPEVCRELNSSNPRVRIFIYDEYKLNADKSKHCFVKPFGTEAKKGYLISDDNGKYIGNLVCVLEPKENCSGFIYLGANNYAQPRVYVDQIDNQKIVDFVDTVRNFATQHTLERGKLAVGQKYEFK
jgi:hypothetical protein